MTFKIDYNNPDELKLLHAVSLFGHHLRQQYRVDYIDPETGKHRHFRIDLADPATMLAVEVDGDQWHSTPEQVAHDAWRQAILESLGWRVIRFRVKRVRSELFTCSRLVVEAIAEATDAPEEGHISDALSPDAFKKTFGFPRPY